MPSRRSSAALALVACLLSPACLREPFAVSDTGYVGTWQRGNDRATSTLAVVRDGDGYRVRWTKTSREPDGTEKLKVRCDWDGSCVETLNGRQIATHRFRPYVDAKTGRLMIETREVRTEPERMEIVYLDEFVVEQDGRVLGSYTIERGGQRYDGPGRPQRFFEKVSDAVAWAPRPRAS